MSWLALFHTYMHRDKNTCRHRLFIVGWNWFQNNVFMVHAQFFFSSLQVLAEHSLHNKCEIFSSSFTKTHQCWHWKEGLDHHGWVLELQKKRSTGPIHRVAIFWVEVLGFIDLMYLILLENMIGYRFCLLRVKIF